MRTPFDLPGRDLATEFPVLVALLNRAGFLERSICVPLRGQTGAGVSLNGYRRADTTTAESWYACARENATALTTLIGTANNLWAVPFVAESPLAWDRMACEITANGAAGGRINFGVYGADMDPDGVMYPGPLLLEMGSTVADAGAVPRVASKTIEFVPEIGRLYFAALHFSNNATVRSVPLAALRPSLGTVSTLGTAAQVAYIETSTYSAAGMPATFPTGAALNSASASVPAVFLRHAVGSDHVRTYPGEYVDVEGMVLRRVLLASSADLSGLDGTPWYTIQPAVRRGGRAERFGTFDSRSNRLSAGGSFRLSQDDLDLPLRVGDAPEVVVTQSGFPWADLSDLMVRFVLAYEGGADGL